VKNKVKCFVLFFENIFKNLAISKHFKGRISFRPELRHFLVTTSIFESACIGEPFLLKGSPVKGGVKMGDIGEKFLQQTKYDPTQYALVGV
jgi:hypothetical protein